MQFKTLGMFRGSAKGYIALRVANHPLTDLQAMCARAQTSDGGDLPCSIFALQRNAQHDVADLAIAFPLFESSVLRLSLFYESDEVAYEAIEVPKLKLKWYSRLIHRVKPDFCAEILRAEEEYASRRNRIEIAQVFDGDGCSLYRAWVYGRATADLNLTLRDDRGKATVFDYQIIEEAKGSSPGNGFSVISFQRKDSYGAFSIEDPGCIFDAVDGPKRCEMIGARDAIMINPAIDSRYSAKVGSVADEWTGGLPPKAQFRKDSPVFSIIVPLYKTPQEFLREMIDSVVGQTYSAWELVLVNASPECDGMKEVLGTYGDPRIRVVELEENLGISGNTNAGIAVASGEYLAFLDHDDMLSPTLLAVYAQAIEEDPEIDILYCDEDSFSSSEGPRFSPLFKPDLNKALLYSHNYVVHCLAVSRRVLGKIELSPRILDGAQDYDLTLKALEQARKCRHIPQVLYHWRVHAGSTNGGSVESKPYVIEAGRQALSHSFERRGTVAEVEPKDISCVYRIDMGGCKKGSLALVLVYRDGQRAKQFLSSMAQEISHASSLILIGNGVEAVAQSSHTVLPPEFLKAIEWNEPYDYASMVNRVAESISEEYVWVCQEGVRSVGHSHVDNLVGWLSQGEAGIVAPRLSYPDGLVQHAGLCVKSDGSIGYLNQNFTLAMGGGYLGTAECCCAYSAVAPDCVLFKRELFLEVGGLEGFGSNDVAAMVDLCFKVRRAGNHVVVIPESVLVNYAHVIRADKEEGSLSSRDPEIARLWQQWGDEHRQDVLHNPNVGIDSSYFQLSDAYSNLNEN